MSGTPPSRAESSRPAVAPLPGLGVRRGLLAFAVGATTLAGAGLMARILAADGLAVLELALLSLFTLTFAWIALAFWSALAGFVLCLTRRDPLTLAPLPARMDEEGMPLRRRTVLAMPIHNEVPQQVVAALEATAESLIATGEAHHFEAFVLSDTTDPTIADAEADAVAALQRRLAGRLPLHYRRRADNAGRKAGNLADFCRRWGGRYDFLIGLDADSRLTGSCLVGLVRALQARPEVALIQTVPLPARQSTLFGRLSQFAAALYAPMLAAGQSVWQGDTANYWGHNAILRLDAFTACAGLPPLPGRPPLGGEILSHDFVEAALLRRGGWQVQLDTRLGGSYEEMPGNLLDYARRDRRWTQGNLQHLRLIAVPGLHPLSRLHFVMGAMAFVASLLWLAILALGSLDAALRAHQAPSYFREAPQLFPMWPEAHPELIASLFALTLALLFAPKLMGLTLALARRAAAFGGAWRLIVSALAEALVAVLLAPLMMAFHSRFVIEVLVGGRTAWTAQPREGRPVPWHAALVHTAPFTVLGVAWAAAIHVYAPLLFWWLAPIWAGLSLAPLLVRLSGVRVDALIRRELLATHRPAADTALLKYASASSDLPNATPLPPPPEMPRTMLEQPLLGRRGARSR
ncbi:glucans biosynthesis glucosyltransferase MdoH [Billgrantia gudaonensis]|uniref:Glucans biosynthesis glucosyltransferase H n=1 Tax=Billgrantia gudaonensis TaxID=376427 RepID=A0A1G8ZIM5_9GAMM|nr:glucans biosynthesis glucosyltransferase MdoH [Halomonas gudaonensis]SDK14921.1 membrane glycosyltransferase [Halomonas gudaonensis]